MKKFHVLLLLLIVLSSSLVFAQPLQEYETLTLKETIKNTITVSPKSSQFSLNEVEARLYAYPVSSSRQTINNQMTTPFSESLYGALVFTWKNPAHLELHLEVDTTIGVYIRYGHLLNLLLKA